MEVDEAKSPGRLYEEDSGHVKNPRGTDGRKGSAVCNVKRTRGTSED